MLLMFLLTLATLGTPGQDPSRTDVILGGLTEEDGGGHRGIAIFRARSITNRVTARSLNIGKPEHLVKKAATLIEGCVYSAIAACADDIQEELASTRFVVNIVQLNAYCDKMTSAHHCILSESETCPTELRTAYAQTVKAEQNVLKDLCRPGPFQEEYLRGAACIAEIYSEGNTVSDSKEKPTSTGSDPNSQGGPCRKQYSRLLHVAFETARLPRNSSSKSQPTQDVPVNASTLQDLCCAYYAVYECTQAHASRCGGLSRTKFSLRQIYQGLEHNCRPYKSGCSITIKHPPPPHRPGGYQPGFSGPTLYGGSSGAKKAKARPLPGGHGIQGGPSPPTIGTPTSAASPVVSHISVVTIASLILAFVQLILFSWQRAILGLDKS